MASNKLNLTRDELASFLKNHHQIRQFERLFADVEQLEPTTLDDLALSGDNAAQKAVQALDTLVSEKQALEVTVAALEAKVNQAVGALTAISQDLSFLMQAPPPREFKQSAYGSFYDTTTQTAAATGTAYAMTFNTTDLTNGVYIGSPTSRVYVSETTIYDIQFSAQLDNTSGGDHLAYIWLRVNGTDVANSASEVRLKGNNAELVAAWNFLASLNSDDYFELMWSVSDTGVQIKAVAAASPVPGIPSVILTVTDNIQGIR